MQLFSKISFNNSGFYHTRPQFDARKMLLPFVPARLSSQPACQAERGGQGESVAGRRKGKRGILIIL